ncbi:hypothetical protein IR083_18825 [Dysgonomonas sp. GY75]|uniref:hypothetical protein n=1 Tax=Dysgonomonas sp. GY75 TaxID=2780419 RepID=UPI0018832F7C|nr:hypothetical protein [Dysgonomonas sp. GY75]MBF0650875.1 hypothetical protein [Dysgonomonas sp. GY75]
MKRKIREVITMTDNGMVTTPNKVRMNIGEIANLFGIYYQTAKRYTRTIEKADSAKGDYVMGCTADGRKVYPEYYGLEVIIVLAFRVQSKNAQMHRKWIQEKIQASVSGIQALASSNYMFLN